MQSTRVTRGWAELTQEVAHGRHYQCLGRGFAGARVPSGYRAGCCLICDRQTEAERDEEIAEGEVRTASVRGDLARRESEELCSREERGVGTRLHVVRCVRADAHDIRDVLRGIP